MSTRSTPLQPHVEQAAHAADQLASSAEHAVNGVRERVIPAAVRLAGQAEEFAHRGVDAVRDSAKQLRSRAADATDRGVQYVQEEPVKAVMIAAAAGAALVVLAQWATSRRRERV